MAFHLNTMLLFSEASEWARFVHFAFFSNQHDLISWNIIISCFNLCLTLKLKVWKSVNNQWKRRNMSSQCRNLHHVNAAKGIWLKVSISGKCLWGLSILSDTEQWKRAQHCVSLRCNEVPLHAEGTVKTMLSARRSLQVVRFISDIMHCLLICLSVKCDVSFDLKLIFKRIVGWNFKKSKYGASLFSTKQTILFLKSGFIFRMTPRSTPGNSYEEQCDHLLQNHCMKNNQKLHCLCDATHVAASTDALHL